MRNVQFGLSSIRIFFFLSFFLSSYFLILSVFSLTHTLTNDFISVEKDGDLISNEKEIVERFNQNYLNIVENSSGKKLSSLGDCLNTSQDELTVKEIISVYSSHPSIQKIKSVFNTDSKFDLPKPTASDINKIIKSLDTSKATGPDGIPAEFV